MNASTRLRCLYLSLSSKLKSTRSTLLHPLRKNISTQRDANEIPLRPQVVPWSGYVTFLVPIGLFAGSIFSDSYISRYEELLATFAANSVKPVVPIEIATDHCAKVELRGHFDFSREALIVNRPKKTGFEPLVPSWWQKKYTKDEDHILTKKEWGHWVITPFVLDSGKTILVNRGWIPCASIDPASPERRPQNYPNVLTGYLIKIDEDPDLITKLLNHRPDQGRWSFIEISTLSEKLQTEKVLVDLDNSGYIGHKAPLPNQTQLSIPDHYGPTSRTLKVLTFSTFLLWFLKYIGPIKPFKASW